MEDPNTPCPVGDAYAPVLGAVAPPFVEGDQASVRPDKDKPAALDLNEPGFLTRNLAEPVPDDRSERIPSRMVEDRGDDETFPLCRWSPVFQDRSPGEPDVGDNARLPVSAARPAPELTLDPTLLRLINSDAALDEGYMVSELLKKGRLKNSTFTEKGLVLQEVGDSETADARAKKQISVLLEATQNITLRYQVLGTTGTVEPKENASKEKNEDASRSIAQHREIREAVADVVGMFPRALSSSDEMLYFKEKVRSAASSGIERKGASCCRLHVTNPKAPATRMQVFDKFPVLKKISTSTLPPAYSPSQLNISKVKSQIAELTLKKSSRLSQVSLCGRRPEPDDPNCAGTTDAPTIRKMSKITEIVINGSKPAITFGTAGDENQIKETENSKIEQFIPVSATRVTSNTGPTRSSMLRSHDKRHVSWTSYEHLPPGTKEIPLLEVLETAEFPLSSAERAKRRVERYYRRQDDFFDGSPSVSSDESLVKLDLSNIPTETSELMDDRCQVQDAPDGSRAGNVDESSTSWYSFESEPRGSRRSNLMLCDVKTSLGSWRSYMKGYYAVPEVNMAQLAGHFSDASSEVARVSQHQDLGSPGGSVDVAVYSDSSDSLSSSNSYDSGKGCSRPASPTSTEVDQKSALEVNEKSNLKTSNLIRYFENIH